MSEQRPFRDVIFQIILELHRDQDLTDASVRVGIELLTAHIDRVTATGEVYLSEIGSKLNRSAKSIQRALRSLEESKWISVQRTSKHREKTKITPHPVAVKKAIYLRLAMERNAKRKKEKMGQKCLDITTDLSKNTRQICPPILKNININNTRSREARTSEHQPVPSIPSVFVAQSQSFQIGQWQQWLCDNGLPLLEELSLDAMKSGQCGFRLSGYFPPKAGDPLSADFLRYLRARLQRSSSLKVIPFTGRRAS